MRRLRFALVLLILPFAAGAQGRDSTLDRHALPRDVADEVVRTYNATATARVTGALDVPVGRELAGDVAVLGGPVTVAGHLTGSLVAINGNVTLAPTARIDGNLLVVGGAVRGQNRAYVGGEIRIYRDALHYARAGDRISASDTTPSDDSWWRRFERRRDRTGSKILVASAGAYNRVEGLPINLGPQIYHDFNGWSTQLDAYAVLRTASSFRASDNDVGHNLHGEVRLGSGRGILFGAGAYDVVSPVEAWGLSTLETGLASALFRRDYSDYYERHGGSLETGMYLGPDATFTLGYADEHWSPRAERNAWTLFNAATAWRPNPTLDDAHVHRVNATLRIDTRSDVANPWAGWYVLADLERGSAEFESLGAMSSSRSYPASGPARYDRGFLDVRRYNRVSRNAQLNVRLVAGGWLGGDPLPMERRLSTDGYDALPGFGFGTGGADPDVSTCAVGGVPAGTPAQCDRVALVQAEYRSDLHVHLFDWDDDSWVRPHFTADGAWVLFLDAGRGWLVDGPSPATPVTYSADALPSFSTFRTDLGVGLDFDHVGIYVAKALSQAGMPARVFVRLQHRF